MADYWPHYTYYKTNELCRKTVFARIAIIRKELAELRMKGEIGSQSSTKEKKDEASQNKADCEQDTSESLQMQRDKLEEQQLEICLLRDENQKLRTHLQHIYEKFLPRSDQNYPKDGTVRETLWLEESKIKTTEPNLNDSDSTINLNETQPVASNADKEAIEDTEKDETIYRLQLRLHETEESFRKAQNRADHMTYLLNQKLIELNKLQLTLSGQTKEMIQLEKAYFQLKCQVHKGYRSSTPSFNSSRVDLSTT